MNEPGSFCLVLHCHLPYVLGHGRWPHGADTLFEATAETYLPLLATIDDLVAEGISPKSTIGITPVLAEQLAQPAFPAAFESYCAEKIAAAESDASEFTAKGQRRLAGLAQRWRSFYEAQSGAFVERYSRDIIGAFRRLWEDGHIEILTSAATHGYLPLLGYDACIRAQLAQGTATHERLFGRKPRGLWLPECAYRPAYPWRSPVGDQDAPVARQGIEALVAEAGLEYFVVDTPLLKGGKAIGVYLERFGGLRELWEQFAKSYTPPTEDAEKSPYQLYLVGAPPATTAPVTIFTRDPRTGLQVWSGGWGYPGDGNYLDFHKKHTPGGLRYWKVTAANADLADKLEYDPDTVDARLRENAGHFVSLARELMEASTEKEPVPLVCAPYDAELFGHWWFEGPRFLSYVWRWSAADPSLIPATMGEHLDRAGVGEVVELPEGSWGEGGFHWIWFNDDTRWMWERLYDAETTMVEMAAWAPDAGSELGRVLRQMGRELLLMEGSDWQFLISTRSAADYSISRFNVHAVAFEELGEIARHVRTEYSLPDRAAERIADIEARDPLFSDVDPAWWAPDGEARRSAH
jgi:1,4-alpha-glucan branching enzyme